MASRFKSSLRVRGKLTKRKNPKFVELGFDLRAQWRLNLAAWLNIRMTWDRIKYLISYVRSTTTADLIAWTIIVIHELTRQ